MQNRRIEAMPMKIGLELEACIHGLVTSEQLPKHLMAEGIAIHYSFIGRVVN